MRWESLILGIVIVAFGAFLVASHGSVAGVSVAGLLGLPCSGGSNSTACPGYFGYSIGTVVVLFGLGLVGNGLRTPSMPKGSGPLAPGMTMPPELVATLEAARSRMQTMGASAGVGGPGPGIKPDVRYCSKCGTANAVSAQFCQQCGTAMPPPGGAAPSLR